MYSKITFEEEMKDMKKTNVFLGLLFVLILLVGCGNQEIKEEEKEPQYADKVFIEDMSKGLQARWDLNSKDEQKEGYDEIPAQSDENKKMMLSYINAELDIIGKYKDEKFEDSKLQELAIKYINLLNQHKEACDYITVDYEKYDEEFQPIYNERSNVIKTMVEDYGMKVEEKHQGTLDDFLANSKLVSEQKAKEEEIDKMLSNIQFKETERSDEWGTYQAVVENTTDIDFKTFNININLLDKDGVIVETAYDNVSAFSKGAKVRFEFTTDKKFDSTQVIADWWE